MKDFLASRLTEGVELKNILLKNIEDISVLLKKTDNILAKRKKKYTAKLKENLIHFNCPIVEITSESREELINDYTDQSTLGVDRWLAAMGAWKLYGEDAIVINAGTAITIDLIQIDKKRKAHFRGGMILPGIAISLGILNNSTNLIDTEIGQSQYPSVNTKDAVTTGILMSIQGAVNLVCKKLPSNLPILLCGGDADLIFSQSEEDWKSRIKIESDLIFEGLMSYV